MNVKPKHTIAVKIPFALILLALLTVPASQDSLVMGSCAVTLTNAALEPIPATKMPDA